MRRPSAADFKPRGGVVSGGPDKAVLGAAGLDAAVPHEDRVDPGAAA